MEISTRPKGELKLGLHGKIKMYNTEKGWGFLMCKDVDKDIFFHVRNIEDEEKPKQDLCKKDHMYADFDLDFSNDNNPQAFNVRIYDEEENLARGRVRYTRRPAAPDARPPWRQGNRSTGESRSTVEWSSRKNYDEEDWYDNWEDEAWGKESWGSASSWRDTADPPRKRKHENRPRDSSREYDRRGRRSRRRHDSRERRKSRSTQQGREPRDRLDRRRQDKERVPERAQVDQDKADKADRHRDDAPRRRKEDRTEPDLPSARPLSSTPPPPPPPPRAGNTVAPPAPPVHHRPLSHGDTDGGRGRSRSQRRLESQSSGLPATDWAGRESHFMILLSRGVAQNFSFEDALEIEGRSGAQLTLHVDPGGDRRLEMEASSGLLLKDAVTRVVKEVARGASATGDWELKLLLPRPVAALVIGSKGKNIRAINNATGCQAQVFPPEDKSSMQRAVIQARDSGTLLQVCAYIHGYIQMKGWSANGDATPQVDHERNPVLRGPHVPGPPPPRRSHEPKLTSVPSSVPFPWVTVEHPDDPGSYYYHNEESGEVSWNLPSASPSDRDRSRSPDISI